MNKPLAVLGSISFSICTALAQNALPPPPPALAPGSANGASTTRHGRVQDIMATPEGNISGLFLGRHIAVALSPELSRQITSLSLRGREVTVYGPTQTIGESVTVEAQTLRVGGKTFIATPGPQLGMAAPPFRRAGEPRELAALSRGPEPNRPLTPPPPPAGAPVPPPPPAEGIAPPPPPKPNDRNQGVVLPPVPSAAPGVNGAAPSPPPATDGSHSGAAAAPPQQ